jgi:hypothetical protein
LIFSDWLAAPWSASVRRDLCNAIVVACAIRSSGLAVAVCAVLSGARSLAAIGEQAADAPT